MAFGNFTLTGQFFGLDGVTPAVGRVTIDGIPQVIIDTGSNKIRVGPRTVVLGSQGEFSINLPSDSTTGNSTSIAFRVTPNLKHANLTPVEFYARPIGTTVDLKAITPQQIVALTPTGVSQADFDAYKAANQGGSSFALSSVDAAKTASATLTANHHTPVDATSGAKTMTLPTGAAVGVLVSVEKTDASSNAVTITGTMRGVTSSIPLTTQYEARTFLSEGSSSWRPISDHRTAASLEKPGGALTRLRAVAIGDSTTAGGLRSVDGTGVVVGSTWAPMDSTGVQQGGVQSWFTWACLLSGGRLLNVYNAGIGSDTTAGMVARFATDVVAKSPDVVFIGDAHNDFSTGSGITETQTRANIDTMVKAARAAQIMPILRLIYPENNSIYTTPIRRHNNWLLKYAAANRLTTIDTYAAAVDPASTTGGWLTGYSSDGTHATPAAAAIAGAKAVADLAGLLRGNSDPSRAPWTPKDNVVDQQRLTNPLMVNDVNNDGTADNWSFSSTGTGRTVTDGVTTNTSTTITSATANFAQADLGKSITGTGIPGGAVIRSVTDASTAVLSANATATGTGVTFVLGAVGKQLVTDAAVLGKAWQITLGGTSPTATVYQQVNVDGTSFSVGDRVKFAGLIKTTGAAAGALNYSIQIVFPGVASYLTSAIQQATSVDIPGWAYFEFEAVIPAGATVMRAQPFTSASGTAVVSVAQCGLTNVSKV